MIAEMEYTSDAKLAAASGLDRHTLTTYRHRGFTGNTVAEVHQWRKENIRNYSQTIGDREGNGGNPNRKELEALKLQKQCEKIDLENREKEIELKKMLGELLDAAECELQVAELVTMVRARLEAIPNELETEWPPEVRALVTERLADKIRLILTEMSQWRLEAKE